MSALHVAVELRGVDVVDAAPTACRNTASAVSRSAFRSLELHRAEADPGDRPPRQPRGAARSGDGGAGVRRLACCRHRRSSERG